MGISGRRNSKSLKQEARNALQMEQESRVEGKREAAGPGEATSQEAQEATGRNWPLVYGKWEAYTAGK